MNTNSFKTFFAVACVLLMIGSLTGCLDEEFGGTYEGPPLLQFHPQSGSVLDGAGEVAIEVQLVAATGTLPESHQFSVTVVGDETTAQAYELLTPTPTLPADSVFSEVRVRVGNGNIPPGETRTLTLQLQPSQDGVVGVAENFEQFTLTIVGRSADVTVSRGEVTFSGNVALNVPARTDTVVVTNTTEATETTTITNVTIVDNPDSTGMDADQFALVSAPAEPLTLTPGESDSIFVKFSPDMEGDFDALLAFEATNVETNEAVSLGVAISGGATNDDGTFVAELQPLNRFQEVSGTATFVVNTAGVVSATVEVEGLPRRRYHAASPSTFTSRPSARPWRPRMPTATASSMSSKACRPTAPFSCRSTPA